MIRILKVAEGAFCFLGFGSAIIYVATSVAHEFPAVGQFAIDYGYQITIGSLVVSLAAGSLFRKLEQICATISKGAQ